MKKTTDPGDVIRRLLNPRMPIDRLADRKGATGKMARYARSKKTSRGKML